MLRPKPQRPAVIDDQHFQQAREAAVILSAAASAAALILGSRRSVSVAVLIFGRLMLAMNSVGMDPSNVLLFAVRESCAVAARLALRFHHRRADDLFALLDHPVDEVGPRRCLGSPVRRIYALQMLIDR